MNATHYKSQRLTRFSVLAVALLAACTSQGTGSGDSPGTEPGSDAGVVDPAAVTAQLEGPEVVTLSACASVSAQVLVDDLVAELDVALLARADAGLTLYADGACDGVGQEALEVTVAAGQGDTKFWIRGADVGAAQLSLSIADKELSSLDLAVVRGYDADALLSRVLVVYNSNIPDSKALAEYYAAARGISDGQLCPVAFPPGNFASAEELLGARRTIVEDCICSVLDPAAKPEPCTVEQAASIAQVSPISHLALMKGVPIRLTETDWTDDDESPSLAPFLSYLLYHDEVIFGNDSKRYLQPSYPLQGPLVVYPPALDPGTDGWAAYGQVEATDNASTRALIDRTLAAERQGFTGNILVEESTTSPLSVFIQELTSTFDQSCFDYLSKTPFIFGDPASSWPHSVCRYGTTASTVATQSGGIPGEDGTTIPKAVGVGLFLGTNPWPNTQVGFDGFGPMLNWHASEDSCTELCSDLDGPAGETCALASNDIFGELNSTCVGVAEGFLGFQIRSWPVQYMGFYPSGWAPRETGSVEKDAPRVLTGGAFKNERFTDDSFVRFGRADFEEGATDATPTCTTGGGASQACPERVAINMDVRVPLDPPLPFIEGSREFTVRLRYRNAASPPEGALVAWGVFQGGGTEQWYSNWRLFPDAHSEWTTWQFTMTAEQASLGNVATLDNLALFFVAQPTPKPLLDYFDLDGIEIIDAATGTQLLDADIGSFAATGHERNKPGDFAANIIDRLGGIGSWGSTSHFVTGGWAYRYADRFAPLFFAGRTLGEAILSSKNPQSGLIYADPLYQPVAVRMRGAGGARTISIHDLVQLDGIKTLTFSAMLGTDHLGDTRWSIDSCDSWDLAACEGSWAVHRRGVGAADAAEIDWTQFKTLNTSGQRIAFRLRVWNEGNEAEALSSHVLIEYETKS